MIYESSDKEAFGFITRPAVHMTSKMKSRKIDENINQSETEEISPAVPGCTKNTKHYFLEFCDNTSIHGFKFLGEEKRTIIERLWWFIVITVSLTCCIYLIVQTYQKWISAPVIVSFATTQTSIRDIPFPAITICSDVKAVRKAFNYTDVELRTNSNGSVSLEDVQQFNYMNMVCEEGAGITDENTKYVDESALEFIAGVAPPLSGMILQVVWRGTTYENAEPFFTPNLSSEGVCYTFNILDREDLFRNDTAHYKNFFFNGNSSNWSIEDGFKKRGTKTYPRSSVVSGIDGGIDFVLHTVEQDIDYECSSNYIGFKVTLQHPSLIPKGRKSFFSVPLNQIVLATVKPIMMKTSPELRSYKPEKRQCFFSNEKRLRFYKNYYQPNCLMECLTNFTLDMCGCVSFYMPRDNSTRICGSGSRKCAERAKVLYLLPNSDKNSTTKDQKSYSEKCHCLPSCTSLDFEVEVSQSNWEWDRFYQGSKDMSNKFHYSRLKVFFKDMQFITSIRNELYGTTDFLASCGGLLGLFMGFSSISLFEILYFMTLRFICNVRKYGKDHWSGSEVLLEVKVDT